MSLTFVPDANFKTYAEWKLGREYKPKSEVVERPVSDLVNQFNKFIDTFAEYSKNPNFNHYHAVDINQSINNFKINFYSTYVTKIKGENGYTFDKITVKKNSKEKPSGILKHHSNSNDIKIASYALVKIKDYVKSSELFLFSNKKKTMMEACQDTKDESGKVIPGKLFNPTTVLFNFQCKKDGILRDIVEIEFEGRNYKFLVEDVEFVFPNVDSLFKGYIPPKDRKVKVGKTIKIKNNKGTRVPHKYEAKVDKLTSLGHMKYVEIMYNDKIQTIPINKVKVI